MAEISPLWGGLLGWFGALIKGRIVRVQMGICLLFFLALTYRKIVSIVTFERLVIYFQLLHNGASNEIKEIGFCKKCPKAKPCPFFIQLCSNLF